MKKKKEIFPGFPKEPTTNYWPYPRALNGWWHALTGSEQKALDYLLRHTWGYKKTSDFISYSQFLNGIKRKKDGVWVDKGCGIKSSATLRKALKGLAEKCFVEIAKVDGRTNFYTLRITNDTVESKVPIHKVNTPSLQNKAVGTLETEDTITDVTIKDSQQVDVWVKEYGEAIIRLIKKYGFRQVSDAIRITRNSCGVRRPIAFITSLCKDGVSWKNTEGAKAEMELQRLREKTTALFKE